MHDVLGGYQATRYLIENGHSQILMLNGPGYISSARERRMGYEKALKEAGIPVDEKLVRVIDVSKSDCSQVLENVMEEGVTFTAIFAFSDILAWEAWTCLHRKGYRIPEDISLVGFDHIQSRMALPFDLTTISSYKAKMSITAVDCLSCKINRDFGKEGHCEEICHHVIATNLVKGETVRDIR